MGVWVWLASELMFFAALFAAYFMIRQTTSDMATAGQQTPVSYTHLTLPTICSV